MRATFALFALAREYFLQPYRVEIRERLEHTKRRYKERYPRGTRYRYTVRLDFKPFKVRRRFVGWFLAIALRRRQAYRITDRIFTIHLLSYVYRLARSTYPPWIPEFARWRAMGIDTVFK